MNKKLLLTTTLAGTMFIAGMANPTFAATEQLARFNSNYIAPSTPSITVKVASGKTEFTRAELVAAVEAKYGDGSVDSVSVEGDSTNVGTSATVRLKSGETITLVLKGDVNDNGIIDARDARAVLQFNAGSKSLTAAEQRAADVRTEKGNIDARDARRILQFNANPNDVDPVDDECMPTDESFSLLELKADFVSGNQTDAYMDTKVSANDTKVGEIVVDGMTLNVKVQTAEVIKTYRSGSWEKWFPIQLTLPEGNWKVGGGLEFTKVSSTQIIVYVDAAKATTTFPLSNESGTASVTVNITDISKPVIEEIKYAKAEDYDSSNAQYPDGKANGALIDGDAAKFKVNTSAKPKTLAFSVNVNRMTPFDIDGKSGNWYKVRIKVKDLDTSLVDVVNADDTSIKYKTEVINENEMYVWLDATVNETKLAFVSKNASKAQLGSYQNAATATGTYTAGNITSDLTVTVTNAGALKIKEAGIATQPGSGTKNPQKINQEKVSIDGSLSDTNTIVVKGSLRDMVPYVFADPDSTTAKSFIPKLKSGAVESTTNADDFISANGHKYYALLVNLNYATANVSWEKATYGNQIMKIDSNTANGNTQTNFFDNTKLKLWSEMLASGSGSTASTETGSKTVLLWLDAEQKETVFNVYTTKDIDEPNGVYAESYKFTVKFVDVSAPAVRKVETDKNIVDVKPATESTLGDAYATNSKAVSLDPTPADAISTTSSASDTIEGGTANYNQVQVKVDARKSAMNVIARAENGTSMWYALKVKTGVSRDELVMAPGTQTIAKDKLVPCESMLGEIPASSLEDDEIVVWIDANDAADQTFVIANKNDTKNTRLLLTVTTTDTSLTKATALAPVAVGKLMENDLKELTSDEFTNTVKNNLGVSKKAAKVLNESIGTLQVNKNLAKECTFRLGTGKWVPVVITLGTAVNVAVEGNIATSEERIALGATAANTTVLWVDVNNVQEKGNAVTIHTTDNIGLQETHTFYFDLKDTATFKEETFKAANFNDVLADDEKREEFEGTVDTHFAHLDKTDKTLAKFMFNTESVSVTSKKEGNVVTVDIVGDFRGMYDTLEDNAGHTGRMFAYKYDLGVDKITTNFTVKSVDKIIGSTELTVDEAKAKLDAVVAPGTNISSTWISDSKNHFGCEDGELYQCMTFLTDEFESWGVMEGEYFRTDLLEFADSKGTGDSLIFIIRYKQVQSSDGGNALRTKYTLEHED